MPFLSCHSRDEIARVCERSDENAGNATEVRKHVKYGGIAGMLERGDNNAGWCVVANGAVLVERPSSQGASILALWHREGV